MKTKRRMRRYVIGTLVLAVLGLGLVALIDGLRGQRKREQRQREFAELKQEITSLLPKGSSAHKVILYLDSKHISHGPYSFTPPEINAEIPYERESAWDLEGGIFIVFRFDHQKKLTDYSIREEWLGP